MVSKILYICKELAVGGGSSESGVGGVTAMSGISVITQLYHWLCCARQMSIVTQRWVTATSPLLHWGRFFLLGTWVSASESWSLVKVMGRSC